MIAFLDILGLPIIDINYLQDKINIADDYVKNEIINRFKKLEIESIDKWAIQYKQSMDELGVKKYTKSSIKGFFDELGLKVSSIVIDTIKSKLWLVFILSDLELITEFIYLAVQIR